MFSDAKELLEYIELNKNSERRSCDYKRGLAWDDEDFQHNLIKDILGMSNLKNGGYIIIGVEKNDHGIYSPNCLGKEVADSYDREKVLEASNKYADPPIDLELEGYEIEKGKYIIVLQISEFLEIPTICKKGYDRIMEQGRIYIRTTRKIETSPSVTSSEMREILELALNKQLAKFKVTLSQTSQELSTIDTDIKSYYTEERKDF